MRVFRTFRKSRALGIEQVAGLLMLVGAFALYWRPNTTSLAWVAALWDVPALTPIVIFTIGAAGFALCLLEDARNVTFGVLTAPLALYGTLALTYALANSETVFSAGMFGAFWIALQFAHAQQREVRRWTKPLEPSS